jgi:hypothetical protein
MRDLLEGGMIAPAASRGKRSLQGFFLASSTGNG